MANANPWATDKAVHHPECTCLDGGCDRRAAKSFVGETMVDAVVAATKGDVESRLRAITAALTKHIKDDAAVTAIVDMVLEYRRAS